MNGEKINAYRGSVGKQGGKRALERHRCILDDNIKVDLKEVGLGLDWIYLAQGYRDQGQMYEHGNGPWGFHNIHGIS